MGVAVVEATGFARSPFLITLGVATVIAGFAGGLSVVSGLAILAGLAVVLPERAPRLAPCRCQRERAVRHRARPRRGGRRFQPLPRRRVPPGPRGPDGTRRASLRGQRAPARPAPRHRARGHAPCTSRARPAGHSNGSTRCSRPDVSAVVLLDPTTRTWHVAAGTGVRTGTPESPVQLPRALYGAAHGTDPVVLEDLHQGLNYRSRWGLYCPMHARDEIVGVLAVEGGDHPAARVHRAAPHRRPGPGRGPGHRQRPLAGADPHPGHGAGADPPGPRAARPHRPVGGVPGLRDRPPGGAEPRAGRAGRPPGAARGPARPRRGAARHARRPAQ